jgi:hypothetical protein
VVWPYVTETIFYPPPEVKFRGNNPKNSDNEIKIGTTIAIKAAASFIFRGNDSLTKSCSFSSGLKIF